MADQFVARKSHSMLDRKNSSLVVPPAFMKALAKLTSE
jgi:hypothetical protein